MRLAARSTMIAGVLSIAAIGAPAASAGVGPGPPTAAQAGPVAPPILRVARASELAAINRAETQERAAGSYSPPAGARYSSAETDAYAWFAHPVAASASTVKAPGEGFDYGAAAVGAGLAVAIIVLIAAGGLAVRRRRQPQFG
jgi:hypothetical protein